MQLVFHLQQLVAFALHEFGDRNASGARNHFGDFFSANLCTQKSMYAIFGQLVVLFGVRFFEALFQLRQFAVLQLGHFVEVAFACEFFNLEADAVNFFFDLCATLGRGFF